MVSMIRIRAARLLILSITCACAYGTSDGSPPPDEDEKGFVRHIWDCLRCWWEDDEPFPDPTDVYADLAAAFWTELKEEYASMQNLKFEAGDKDTLFQPRMAELFSTFFTEKNVNKLKFGDMTVVFTAHARRKDIFYIRLHIATGKSVPDAKNQLNGSVSTACCTNEDGDTIEMDSDTVLKWESNGFNTLLRGIAFVWASLNGLDCGSNYAANPVSNFVLSRFGAYSGPLLLRKSPLSDSKMRKFWENSDSEWKLNKEGLSSDPRFVKLNTQDHDASKNVFEIMKIMMEYISGPDEPSLKFMVDGRLFRKFAHFEKTPQIPTNDEVAINAIAVIIRTLQKKRGVPLPAPDLVAEEEEPPEDERPTVCCGWRQIWDCLFGCWEKGKSSGEEEPLLHDG